MTKASVGFRVKLREKKWERKWIDLLRFVNGDPTDMTVFSSHNRKAFNGLALVIVKAKRG